MTTNTDSPRSDESLDTVRSIMKDVRTCMFVTTADDGSLHSAPMTTQEAEFDGDAWFIASDHSETVRNLTARPHVNIAFAGPVSPEIERAGASIPLRVMAVLRRARRFSDVEVATIFSKTRISQCSKPLPGPIIRGNARSHPSRTLHRS